MRPVATTGRKRSTVKVDYWSPPTERSTAGPVKVRNLIAECTDCDWTVRGATHHNAKSLAKTHAKHCPDNFPVITRKRDDT